MKKSTVITKNQITSNGITFTSEDYGQRYFDRKRTPRLEKKLNVGAHLTLVSGYTAKVMTTDLKERYGEGWLKVLEDKVFELSYADEECTTPNPYHWLGFLSISCKNKALEHYSAWEIPAHNLEVFQACTERLEKALEDVLGVKAVAEGPIFING